MKRMPTILVASAVGLALCGWLVFRHAARTAVTVPPVSDRPAPPPPPSKPMDRWQAGIKPDTGTDCKAAPAATERLMKKLRQEELRQRPQEGRN